MKISKIIEKTLGSHHFVNGIYILIASILIILGFIRRDGYLLSGGLFILVIDQRFDIKNINEKLKQK